MESESNVEIIVNENASFLVKGKIVLKDPKGNVINTTENTYLCRCGHSSKKPFCDGTHKTSGFKG